MLLVLMLFLLSQSRGDNPLLKAKNIETGAELASGSDSSPCLNNADPRSLSSITPPPQQPAATSPAENSTAESRQ